MAQTGTVKTITGIVNARTPDGQVRQLMAGDMVYENEIIETSAGSGITIELSNGKALTLAENSQVVLDETVIAVIDPQDAVVSEAQALQAALEQGEDIPEEEEPAAGEEDEEHDFDLAYYAGDQSRGEVGSYLFPTLYGGADEDNPDVGGDEDDLNPSLSAIGVVVDETDGLNNIVTGTITVDYGTADGTLALAADGAIWNAASNTLTYQQGGTDIWQIILDQSTGEFTFEQLAAFDHGADENDHNTLEEFGVTVTATNSSGNAATTTFTAGIYDDGPVITGNEMLSAQFGIDPNDITSSPEATYPGDVAGVVTGDADGEFGTDGRGGFFLWDALAAPGEEKTSHILVESTPGNPSYEIFMDPDTGEWTFYQYQPIAESTLGFDFRIYDSDTDWAESEIEVPVSQFEVSLSAIGVVVDETDGLNNIVNGNITVDYGTADGTLSLAAAGAVWDVASNTLTYQQGGTDIWQIVLDQDTGAFTFEQLAAFDHGADANDHNTLEEFGVTVTATNSFGNTAATTFAAGIYDDGPRITGNEMLSAEFGIDPDDIASSPEATYPGDVAGVVTGDADGEFGTDGPGGFFLWDALAAPGEEKTSHILVESTPGNPSYEIFMDPDTGEWTFYQYQPIAESTLGFDFRIYDSDTDWAESDLEVPVSQFEVSLSAIGVVVDETDGLNNIVNGNITVDYGTADGTLSLAAAGAIWNAASNTLTYQQGGTDIWQIVLDQDTGEFSFEQLAAFDHGADANDHNTLEEFGVTVTATNSFGNTAATTFAAGIYDDGPRITQNEILSAELGIAADNIPPLGATFPDDVIGLVTGDADGRLGTDGSGGFFLWDASAAPGNEMTDRIQVNDTSGNLAYEIAMNSNTGEWTFYQYQSSQSITEGSLNFDFRIYDGDTDWVQSNIEVPVSQFIVGSDPEGLQDETSSNIQFGDDITGSTDLHAVPSPAAAAGEILGQGGADVLVGDPGSVIPEPFSSNYIMVLDYSHSVTDTTSLLDVLEATKETIRTLYGRVERGANDSEVTINLLPFAEDANVLSHSASISFEKQNDGSVDIELSINTGAAVTVTIDEIMDWIDDSASPGVFVPGQLGSNGLTDYKAAFTAAQFFVQPPPAFGDNPNHVIFISDGSSNDGGDYTLEHGALAGSVASIRAVGINLNGRTEPVMDAIDYPAGEAVNFVSGQLADVIIGLIPQDFRLNSVGNDEIYGNDGNDLIFGDALNTDGVFEDLENEGYDLSSIKDLPDGSGWEVFAELEAANAGDQGDPGVWTREDTIRYIQENHEDLSVETVQEDKYGPDRDDVRYGGNDEIWGGDGDDIIYGQEGDDTIDAGAGDDVIDGGSGFDTLMVTNETELDFSNVSNIEKLDLSSDTPQEITLNLNDVLAMVGDGNTLSVKGGAGDEVNFTDGNDDEVAQWTSADNGDGSFTFTMVGAGIQPSVVIAPDSDVNNQIQIDPDIDI